MPPEVAGGSVNHPTLVLIGLRGSGKTTLGRLLATALSVPFVDLDDRTRAKTGHSSVSAAFKAIGEPAFRLAESAALSEVLEEMPAGAVLALGGGTPTAPGARALLEAASEQGRIRIALLDAQPAVLGARLSVTPGDRPLLMGSDFAQEAAMLRERRLPLYRQLASAVVETSQPTNAALEALLAFART